ncbi:Zinc finger, PHD-type, conserved site [Phytophthora cactorum]|nr:Zinc finger, PHD-type, conserved site [Phytophthora cactorum]
MAARAEGRGDSAFNELAALLLRNEDGEKNAADVELDMRRLLMLTRDAHLRDQFVQVQGVRRVTLIAKASGNIVTRRVCAGFRWNCVSHRHLCPLSMLLANTHSSGDEELARVSTAALLAFSTQNHCQQHLDKLAGIPVLLRLLDVKQADNVATDVAIYAAAILWNMCKAPALLLKLEVRAFELVVEFILIDLCCGAAQTIYGVLKDHLTRMPVLLDFEGENLNVLVTAVISSELSVVLAVQNYVGRARSLADQFRPKTPPASAVVARSKALGGSSIAGQQAVTSVAHYGENGVLSSRTCAVCVKLIPVKPSRRKRTRPSLLCSRDGCGQMYHLSCSRWASLSEETKANIAAGKSDTRFYCDTCVIGKPLCYWDFLTAHSQHELLLTENVFKSIIISRVSPTPTTSTEAETTQSTERQHDSSHHQHTESTTSKSVADIDEEDGSTWPFVMLLDRNSNLVGVGEKCFRVAASSRDPEMYIVTVRYLTIRSYSATRQERAISMKGEGSANNAMADSKWEVSYARQEALDLTATPGSAAFWPVPFTRDILALEYTRRSLYELENVCMYEFQGEQPHDKTFSLGSKVTGSSYPNQPTGDGLWMALTPRKGICMKLLATQIGHLKKLQEVQMKKSDKPKASKAGRKIRKPHFPGQQLNKIAVDTTTS